MQIKNLLNYTLTFLPEKIFPGLTQKHAFDQESLYETIQNVYKVKITKARRTMEAILAKDEIAEYLELKEGSPIILFRCVTYGIVNGKRFLLRILSAIIAPISLNSILIK